MNSHTSARIKFPSGFWSGLKQLGIAPRDVARKARLPLTILNESKVTTAEYFAIWQAYSELIGDTAEAIIGLVRAFESGQYPPAALATYHAAAYRDALYRMVRYKQMCPPESLRMIEEEEDCIIELGWQHTGEAGPGPQILIGITLAYLLELGRRGTGRALTAQCVELVEPMGNVQMLEAYFGCPVRVGADRNRLTLYRRDLDTPFVSYNEELLEILTPVMDQTLGDELRSDTVTEKVKWILKRNLMGGRPDMEAVAKELSVSERTLQRRLMNEGTGFKELLTQTRHEQAKMYLADPSLEIKEVAFLVGYEDQNSFYRAFRLWEGDTPSHWRSERLGISIE